MEQEIKQHIQEAKDLMERSIDHLHKELLKLRTGKANPSMLDGIMVEYYGSPTPLNQVANVSATDSKTLTIQPWEKSMLAPIEKAIFEANLGLTPMNDGENVRINIPPLTEERRKDMVKVVKSHGEDAKVSLRQARHKVLDFIKKAVKEHYPEDAAKRKEAEVEKMTEAYSNKVDKLVEAKEHDVMTV